MPGKLLFADALIFQINTSFIKVKFKDPVFLVEISIFLVINQAQFNNHFSKCLHKLT